MKPLSASAMAETKLDDADAKESAPRDSIESLFAVHEMGLLAYAQSLVKDHEAAQDMVQEAFLKLHAEFEEVRQPQAWLYRTVHNLALNHLRARRKIVPMHSEGEGSESAELTDAQPLPDEYLERIETIGQTRLSLEILDARSRELVRLKFEEGLSYKEISQRTDLSISNVGYLLHHALKDLAAALKKAGVMS